MTDVLPPKQRLAVSRAALLAAMGYSTTEKSKDGDAHAPFTLSRPEGSQTVRRSLIARWWRRSHLSTAAEIGEPFLQDYASKHPAKLIAYSVGLGSLIVLVKPWRLLSFGMVAGLLLRSTDLRGFLSDWLLPELGDTDGPRDDFLDRPPQ